MLNRPTYAPKRLLALTVEAGAAVVLAALALTFAVQRDFALAVVLTLGSASFVVDVARRIRRESKD